MKKEERIKGEEILTKWAEARGRILDIQKEINMIKKGINPLLSEELEDDFEIKETYNKLMYEMLSEMKKKMIEYKNVEDIINQLENFERNIIIYRYQKKYSWDKIAMENHISRTNCFNIKNRIIKKIIAK